MMNGSHGGAMQLSSGRYVMRRQFILPLILLLCLLLVQLGHTTADTDASKDSIDQRLDGMEAAAEAALAERTAGATKYKELISQVNELMEENKRLESLEKQLVQRTLAVDDLVRKANAVQLKYLASQLNLTIEKELQKRASIEKENHYEEVDLSNTVTLEQLEQQTQPSHMLEESEKQLEAWILQVIQDEIANYHVKAAEMCSSRKCVTPLEAAQLVQASLTTYANDGVNKLDHAQGAQIVHELTSETYNPPADDPKQLLGNVWWRKFIPDDWERVFPSQWEEWKAGVPSFLRHTFVSSLSLLHVVCYLVQCFASDE